MALAARIVEAFGRAPSAPALIARDAAITYRALEALVASAVVRLRAEGVGPGDVVALALPQSSLYLVSFLALGWIGAVTIPIAPGLATAVRDELLRKFKATVWLSNTLAGAPEGVRAVVIDSLDARGDESFALAGDSPAGDGTPLRFALTSGTTGIPRGVLQTHASFLDRAARMHCDVVERPRVLPGSLGITASLNLALHALFNGGAIVFPRGYENAPFFDALRRHAVTHVALPPANLAVLLAALPPGGVAFPAIRHLRLLGSRPSVALLKEVRERFSPHYYLPYGVGELGVVSMATPEMLDADNTTSGPLEPGVEMEIVGGDGAVLARGKTGEIRVRIPGMPSGYHGEDASDRVRFRDGWFYPQDRGALSADGRVRLEGRLDDLLVVGGYKAAPQEIEAVLLEFPGVREAAVHGFEDGGFTRLAALIVASGPIDWAALEAFALRRLTILAPVRYAAVESLPRNAMGKLDRKLIGVTLQLT